MECGLAVAQGTDASHRGEMPIGWEQGRQQDATATHMLRVRAGPGSGLEIVPNVHGYQSWRWQAHRQAGRQTRFMACHGLTLTVAEPCSAPDETLGFASFAKRDDASKP